MPHLGIINIKKPGLVPELEVDEKTLNDCKKYVKQ